MHEDAIQILALQVFDGFTDGRVHFVDPDASPQFGLYPDGGAINVGGRQGRVQGESDGFFVVVDGGAIDALVVAAVVGGRGGGGGGGSGCEG